MRDWAQVGAGGRHPGNMHRDLIAKMQKSVEMPQVYVASVPFWDHHKNRYTSNVSSSSSSVVVVVVAVAVAVAVVVVEVLAVAVAVGAAAAAPVMIVAAVVAKVPAAAEGQKYSSRAAQV